MIHNDKESLQPFLDEENDAQDGSFELPELNTNSQISAGGGRNSSPYDSADEEELSGGRRTVEKSQLISRRSCTRAILFMLGAQVFSASMNVSIRLLENTETHLHPLQILFVRMSITTVILSLLSLSGVVLIAAPDAILPWSSSSKPVPTPPGLTTDEATATVIKRLQALAVGLLGVCGSAAAFLSMSALGKAENPLTVVNYFAALCTAASLAGLFVLPGLGGFRVPGDWWEWVLLCFSGVSGFLMQFLITLSLQAEKSLVAVNMVYTQIVFSLVLDGVVFHIIPHAVSLFGCTLIVGSAVLLAWHKTRAQRKAGNIEDGP
ncbi:hypothetical protein J7T55_007901 [Diaporthe amygdali]|uniref:uncharacterized protein n=1 Tax=Phomopsis amygdali TaxID=1214568 RepID=UPI0022FEB01C|nr:uncharacterized protein J7T55_007901 [Diaporthe amygdali]KAJ0114067.1 hypothetical protein J7T55_007901 [Diaporthe amygdali]